MLTTVQGRLQGNSAELSNVSQLPARNSLSSVTPSWRQVITLFWGGVVKQSECNLHETERITRSTVKFSECENETWHDVRAQKQVQVCWWWCIWKCLCRLAYYWQETEKWVGRAAGIWTPSRSRRTAMVPVLLSRIVHVLLLHTIFWSNSELMTQS